MKKQYFAASIIREGVLGGGVIVSEEEINYKTGKLTVSPSLRDLHLYFSEIKKIVKNRFTVSVVMKNGEVYQFIIFGRKRFFDLKCRKLYNGMMFGEVEIGGEIVLIPSSLLSYPY